MALWCSSYLYSEFCFYIGTLGIATLGVGIRASCMPSRGASLLYSEFYVSVGTVGVSTHCIDFAIVYVFSRLFAWFGIMCQCRDDRRRDTCLRFVSSVSCRPESWFLLSATGLLASWRLAFGRSASLCYYHVWLPNAHLRFAAAFFRLCDDRRLDALLLDASVVWNGFRLGLFSFGWVSFV